MRFLRRTGGPRPDPPVGKLWIADCQMRLALLWLVPSLGLFVLLITQTYNQRFDQPNQAWEWLTPIVLPTISVIVGGIVHTASNPEANHTIDQNLYRLCLWLSWFYLGVLVLSLVLAGPAAALAARRAAETGITDKTKILTPLQWLEMSKLWLMPLQAPVGIVLGVFFASSQPASGADPSQSATSAAPTR